MKRVPVFHPNVLRRQARNIDDEDCKAVLIKALDEVESGDLKSCRLDRRAEGRTLSWCVYVLNISNDNLYMYDFFAKLDDVAEERMRQNTAMNYLPRPPLVYDRDALANMHASPIDTIAFFVIGTIGTKDSPKEPFQEFWYHPMLSLRKAAGMLRSVVNRYGEQSKNMN